MSIIFKTLFAAVALAICSVAFHHVTGDAIATHPGVVAVKLPERKSEPLDSINSRNATEPLVTSSKTNFSELQEHLAAARTAAQAMPGYAAILEMQEEVDEELRPVDHIEFKMRREPFSVYMRWTDSEQEALYVQGENDDRLIVKPTKGLAAIRRVWRLDPDCKMAKQTCRYSIRDAGMENLVARIQSFYDQKDEFQHLADCNLSDATVSNRDVTVFDVQFNDRKAVPKYCASTFCFDKETKLLISVNNYGWSNDEKPRLIEHYVYSEIEVQSQPDNRDFTHKNPEYGFVKK